MGELAMKALTKRNSYIFLALAATAFFYSRDGGITTSVYATGVALYWKSIEI